MLPFLRAKSRGTLSRRRASLLKGGVQEVICSDASFVFEDDDRDAHDKHENDGQQRELLRAFVRFPLRGQGRARAFQKGKHDGVSFQRSLKKQARPKRPTVVGHTSRPVDMAACVCASFQDINDDAAVGSDNELELGQESPLSEAVAVPEVMFTRPPGAALVLAPPSMVMSPPLPVEVVPTKS